MEQVRRAINVYLEALDLPPRCQERMYRAELERQANYCDRAAKAAKSHCKTRRKRLLELGIDLDNIKSILPKPPQR